MPNMRLQVEAESKPNMRLCKSMAEGKLLCFMASCRDDIGMYNCGRHKGAHQSASIATRWGRGRPPSAKIVMTKVLTVVVFTLVIFSFWPKSFTSR